MLTKLKKYVLSKNKKGHNLVLILLDEEVYNKLTFQMRTLSDSTSLKAFEDKFGIYPSQFVLYGETNIWDQSDKIDTIKILEDILPKSNLDQDSLTKEMKPNYKCYCTRNIVEEGVLIHKTAESAWRCLMIYLQNPKYCVIYEDYKRQTSNDV